MRALAAAFGFVGLATACVGDLGRDPIECDGYHPIVGDRSLMVTTPGIQPERYEVSAPIACGPPFDGAFSVAVRGPGAREFTDGKGAQLARELAELLATDAVRVGPGDNQTSLECGIGTPSPRYRHYIHFDSWVIADAVIQLAGSELVKRDLAETLGVVPGVAAPACVEHSCIGDLCW